MRNPPPALMYTLLTIRGQCNPPTVRSQAVFAGSCSEAKRVENRARTAFDRAMLRRTTFKISINQLLPDPSAHTWQTPDSDPMLCTVSVHEHGVSKPNLHPTEKTVSRAAGCPLDTSTSTGTTHAEQARPDRPRATHKSGVQQAGTRMVRQTKQGVGFNAKQRGTCPPASKPTYNHTVAKHAACSPPHVVRPCRTTMLEKYTILPPKLARTAINNRLHSSMQASMRSACN
jgi:hypothetical protein